MISDVIRRKISQKLTGEREIKFQNTIPDDYSIARNIHELDKIGLYLHIPFCNQICPYCPYNKEISDCLEAKASAVLIAITQISTICIL